jgi:hypothetical protein
MSSQKVFDKLYTPRKRKFWKWIVFALVIFFLMPYIILRVSIGELSELGILRVTGFPESKNYLIIFQNNAERRPTGGFITAYATLTFRAGIPFFKFGNVYDEKLIQKGTESPSEIMQELLSGDYYPGHGFRDGNFDPDFPTTSEELIRLFRLGFPDSEFDGVIAVDFTAFEDFAQVFMSEFSEEAGLFAQIENAVQDIDLHNPEEIQTRKNFLAVFAKSLIQKAIFNPKVATQIILKNLHSKHILFYFRDPELQKIVQSKNWGGFFVEKFDGDFLAINEGNYGGMKSSRYLVRDIFYDLDFKFDDSGKLITTANLKIKIAHRGDAAEPISGFYKGSWRIFTPMGVDKISQEKFDKEFDNGSQQVFGKIITMNPSENREIILSYELPESVINDGVYRLKLVKQPGSDNDFMRVSAKLASGIWKMENKIDGLDIKENLAIYQVLLDSDKELELQILPDNLPPRLAWQNFVGQNFQTIDLRFNEALDAESVEQANFDLTDLNYRNQISDAVRIDSVKFLPPQNIQLKISGITPECREWYELKIDGVSDMSGNVIRDKKVTVVQWVDEFGNNCDPNREL